ncbi:hypothetical protein KDK95_33260 [Actinospica sp. MGRD01-02]|uniref:Uncharacterized protein n=1 Tax=Actinospica acidithermotolerans TaxID=2828514 RepID=A0A941INP9_9ACTN|nr:hypothetical protein [Actinospica acidithermotolerans]MBR7831223.1 hypothetical protein [Actinospica acidithermotolerans]
MGNLDFANNAGFSWYCVLLLVGGLAMIVLGPLRGHSRSGVTLNLFLGIVFFCYGLYLTFGFRGGHYLVSYWVLILPVVLVTRTIRSSNSEKVRQRETAKQARYAELQEAQEAHAAATARRSSAT